MLLTRFALKSSLMLAAVVVSGAVYAQAIDNAAMEKLAKDKMCVTCHTVDKPGPFPNMKAIAKKYDGQKDIVPKLVDKVLNGGSGSFGPLPMPGNKSTVSKDEAEKLVRWMLATK